MVPHPALGYAMVALAATLFAVNGTVSKMILTSGIDSQELTEVRCAGALLGLTLIAAATRPASLRISRRELPLLIALGVGGLALVEWSYFVAIHRVEIGIALLIQFVGPDPRRPLGAPGLRRRGDHLRGIHPARRARGQETRSDLALCLGLSVRDALLVSPRSLVERPRRPSRRRRVAPREPGLEPPPHLGAHPLDDRPRHDRPVRVHVAALRHISATRTGITAMLEPVVAIVVAWLCWANRWT